MKRTALLSFSFVCAATMAFAQIALPPGASPQAPQDPGYQALMATCKTPRPAAPARGGGGGRRAGGPPPAAPAFPPPPADYTVSAIPGVIAAGQKWTKVWEVSGNNADGIIAAPDGDIMIAQNHNSAVVTLEPNGQARTVYKDTHTGGALSRNTKGTLFIVERGLHQRVEELAPQRHVVADKLANGDPLDCLGGVINDITADSKGGAYFTMGGLFHVDPQGKVTQFGQGLNTNGVILSPDEKTLYVTNGAFGAPGAIAAFDVQPDGSLTNQREFVKLPSGGGDGLTVDSKGNLYVTAGPNVHVISPAGKVLGSIPAPWGLISAAFAGRDKKTLYAVVSLIDPNRLQHAYVLSIPMEAQGFKGRAK
ncbi:MAG TPA: SMP-30/gluconolactonase/LRE family protein [Vicinamibacterales bacterium]|nr:SMP-30/gluconolactonase/LRE family protein [Vicinamibacterales bacterium]